MANEVERKFLVDSLPPGLLTDEGRDIRQGYVALDGAVEVRIRIASEQAWLTVKGGSGLTRHEVEVPISTTDAEELWRYTASRRIEKTRHEVMVGGATAEVDVYAGSLAGLVTAEVEFPDEAAARSFEPPAWFASDVTGQDGWSNAALAQFGLPH